MRSGACHRALWLCWETGLLDVLLPELSTFLADQPEEEDTLWRVLDEVDQRTKERGAPLDDVVLIAVLLLEPLREACNGARDRVEAAYKFLEAIVDRLNVPRRIAEPVRRVVALLPRIEAGRAGRFTRTGLYPIALEIASIYAQARGEEPLEAPPPSGSASAESAVSADAPAKRRRRRRRPRADA
jgi:poly(A) polymerase